MGTKASLALDDNQAIYVPEAMSHEFRNPGEERATLILIMFDSRGS